MRRSLTTLGAVFASCLPLVVAGKSKQVPYDIAFNEVQESSISIGTSWEALGPFPSGTREHPFLSSPAYAFLPNRSSHSLPADLDRTFGELPYGWAPQAPKYRWNSTKKERVQGKGWPSSLGVDGVVGWERFETGEKGYTSVSYPDIRWDQLRAHQGWAALQFQSLLRTNVTISGPPSSSSPTGSALVLLDMELIQGQDFALIPHDTSNPPEPMTWYNGDIYSYALSLPSSSPFPETTSPYAHQIWLKSGTYTLLVRAIFEIRMFGEPGAGNAPVVEYMMRGTATHHTQARGSLEIQPGSERGLKELELERKDELDLVGDVMDGWFVGTHLGLGLRTLPDSPSPGARENAVTDIVSVRLADPEMRTRIKLELLTLLNYGNGLAVRIFPGQVRVLAISVQQFEPIPRGVAKLDMVVEARRCTTGSDKRDCRTITFPASIPLDHIPHFTTANSNAAHSGIKFTHLSPTQSPIYTMLIPPLSTVPYDVATLQPTLLALHGAGVEASSHEWLVEIPRRERGWAISPTGGTSWGMDWHGASMESALDALEQGRRWIGEKWAGEEGKGGWGTGAETILLGHSNGGQGAWHVAARHPDKFLGVIPGAGYLKIQDYVSYDTWTSDHYADPALMGILKSALTPYDNDLYASNLAHLPIHAIHGEEDDNVPVSSTRKHVGLVGAWQGGLGNVSYEEVIGANHWYPGFFDTTAIAGFLDGVAQESRAERFVRMHRVGYTITTANPDETSGKGGIRIFELEIPGRLARIEVLPWRSGSSTLQLESRNVASFALAGFILKRFDSVEVNRQIFSTTTFRQNGSITLKRVNGNFAIRPDWFPTRRYGPMIRILSSPRPPAVIYGTLKDNAMKQLRSMAIRLAHSAQTYQRIEMEIIDDKTALEMAAMGQLGDRHLIVFGSPWENLFASWMAKDKGLPVSFPAEDVFTLGDGLIYEAGSGIIFLADHPSIPSSLACMIAGTDAAGLEAAFRLFPVRTGVPVPDWAIVGAKSAWQGAGGFAGAGFWDGDWQYDATMSYLV